MSRFFGTGFADTMRALNWELRRKIIPQGLGAGIESSQLHFYNCD
jgi:hypothetical protein